MHDDRVLRIIRAYDDRVVRTYCWGRFWILRQRFLDEIGQYLPRAGRVLDIGCGFGLFSLYYASLAPGLTLFGLDLNPRRIAMARRAATRLGLANVSYEVADARDYRPDGEYDAIYMLDIIHHVGPENVRPLLEKMVKTVRPGGRLLIKDVDNRPAYKRWFTHALDRLMDPRSPVRYWAADELQALLADVGFGVHRHLMVDYLPYPHVLYICERT
jgi:2-polyprenyl-3-methyl-5-hydroxy-6-metoxy-1,4-benzoquinol methylase